MSATMQNNKGLNVDAARRIDRIVGIPLCFAGSVLRKVLAFFLPARGNDRPPKNILFIELTEMGSAILADPAMQKARRTLDANLYFAIFRKNSPSLGLLGTVPHENIFRMRDSGILSVVADACRFFLWTRRNRIDTVIDLELFSRFTAILTGFSGAVRRVGFHAFAAEGLYRGDFLTHKVLYNPHQHIAKNFVALVNALLAPRVERPYSKTVIPDAEIVLRKVEPTEQAKDAVRSRVRDAWPAYDPARHALVLFNTDASDLIPLRRWPEKHYIQLARMVLDRYPRVVILLTGSEAERERKERIVAALQSERCINFAGRTEIAELPALYASSAFMLTNDSGPAQFASITAMPVFVFFGPETPALYGPLGVITPIFAGMACSPCVSAANHRKSVCDNNLCLQTISADKVHEVLQPTLDAFR